MTLLTFVGMDNRKCLNILIGSSTVNTMPKKESQTTIITKTQKGPTQQKKLKTEYKET